MLKRVSIQNFKSLKDVTLDLQKVNLLIGPNNSGKTNFLKALEFVKERYRSSAKSEDKELTFNRNGLPFQFDLTDNNEKNPFMRLPFNWNKITEIPKENIVLTENDLVPFVDDKNELESLIKSIIIYKPDPNKLLKPGPTNIGADTVNNDVSNIVGFFDRMLGNKYRKTVFGRIESDLQKCIPEFDGISIEETPATDELMRIHPDGKTFKKLGLVNSQQDVTYWAEDLSEGTLYFLALLCIINQPNPPKLLLLEEPEKGIHPRRIWEVMKFIFQLAEDKDIQIILTTHNEHVVNAFASMPEAVFVFDKDEEGATHVRNLQKDIIEPSHRKSEELGLKKIDFETNLGESWMYGLIGGVPTDEL